MHPDLPFADDLGPARVIHLHQPALGLAATVVLDNLACGPAIGGLRMALDVTTAECARLARAMTLKNAAALVRRMAAASRCCVPTRACRWRTRSA